MGSKYMIFFLTAFVSLAKLLSGKIVPICMLTIRYESAYFIKFSLVLLTFKNSSHLIGEK